MWQQILFIMCACCGFVTSGIMGAWTNTAIPFYDQQLALSANDHFWIGVLTPLATLFCTPFMLYLPDMLGRKCFIFLANILEVVASGLLVQPGSVAEILLSRVVEGISNYMLFGVLPVYAAETCDSQVRGAVETTFTSLYCFGIFLVSSVGPYVEPNVLGFIGALFALVGVFGFQWAPESPYYYLQKGDISNAERVLQALQNEQDVGDQLKQMQRSIDKQKTEGKSLWKIFASESTRRRLIVAFILYSAIEGTGITAFVLYVQIMFAKSYAAVVSGTTFSICRMLGTILSLLLVDKVGRKPLLTISGVSTSLLLTLLGAYFYFGFETESSRCSWLGITLMGLYAFCNAIGMISVPFVLAAEIFPPGAKFVCMGFSQLAYSGTASLSVALYSVTSKDGQNIWIPMFIYSGVTIVLTALCEILVKETKKKTLEEIYDNTQ